jgi:hypothetical protein
MRHADRHGRHPAAPAGPELSEPDGYWVEDCHCTIDPDTGAISLRGCPQHTETLCLCDRYQHWYTTDESAIPVCWCGHPDVEHLDSRGSCTGVVVSMLTGHVVWRAAPPGTDPETGPGKLIPGEGDAPAVPTAVEATS